MHYVMSDVHGDFKNFYEMLVKINFSVSDQLYILGDIFDKGKENLCLYSFIRDTDNIFLIKGNHEYLCERYLIDQISEDFWEVCGGLYTRQEVDRCKEEERKELYDFLKSLPVYMEIEVNGTEYFLTHSGYHADQYVRTDFGIIDIRASVEKAVKWNMEEYLFSDDLHYLPARIKFDKKIIVGHYPTILLPEYHRAKIYHSKNYIDIDTGNERRHEGGKLACLRLEDKKEFYV